MSVQPRRPMPPCTGAQRGAALLLAMLAVTLVATLAAAGAWQQWRGVEVEAAERSRQQSAWILTGALDWARLILREDARAGGADHLAEPWAVPLQESRLSSFLAIDKNNNTELDQEAFLSGSMTDLQSRLNVTNLVENGKISNSGLSSFSKLFELLNLPQQELLGFADNLRSALDNSAEGQSQQLAPLVVQRVSELRSLGLSQESLTALTPFITVLPQRTPVNLNTASAEVIYAAVPKLDLAGARRLVQERERTHFKTVGDASKLFPTIADQFSDGQLSVATRYFEVIGALRIDDTTVQERSLVQRDGIEVRTLWRERGTAFLSQKTQ
jgi:general secretion pathway protein K